MESNIYIYIYYIYLFAIYPGYFDNVCSELKQREAYTFEELFTILKQDFLYYKSFYEVK